MEIKIQAPHVDIRWITQLTDWFHAGGACVRPDAAAFASANAETDACALAGSDSGADARADASPIRGAHAGPVAQTDADAQQ